MPLFAVLDLEDVIQERDKTRLDATKSYAAGGSTLTQIEIKPSQSDDYVDVTSDTGDVDDHYLDWQYEFAFDVVDAATDKLDFNENGTALTATLESGVYTPDEMATEIQRAMREISASSGATVLYVVTLSERNAFTITGTLDFSLLPITGPNADISPLPMLGFAADSTADRTAQTGSEVETIDKEVSVRMSDPDNDDDVVTFTKTIPVVSEIADNLFSSDDQLRRHEVNIMSFVPEGRSSWKNIHRRSRDLIMQWLDTEGYMDNLLAKITPKRIQDITELTDWSAMQALQLIFESIHNAEKDVYDEKAKVYEGKIPFYRNRAVLRLDLNEDGTVDLGEQAQLRDCVVVRR